jgi:acyl-CoA thioester hydrolase
MQTLLASYPVVLAIPVAWGDMDAFQHVNNVTYFRYFESGRIAYFEQLEISDFLTTAVVRPILHSVNCRFRIPVTYPDTVHVGVRVTAMGDDRLVMDQCLVSERHGKVAAQGDAITVAFDYTAGAKAPLPATVRAAILALEATVGNTVAALPARELK